ncbi:MAG: cobamide remodeling phosphodiesterase CbiR [Bilophila sp.]
MLQHCPARLRVPGMRLGCTSFLLHDRYVPAVRFAATYCDDIALLLFETGKNDEYLISAAEIREIAAFADGEGLSFNVHLPVDANFATQANARRLTDKALRALERTQPLHPHTVVLHVDFPELAGTGQQPAPTAHDWTARALEELANALPSPERLALENLEGFLPDFLAKWLEGTPYSRCFDIGHIWKDGQRPEALLADWLPRTRLCHLHGLKHRADGVRDHQSLCTMPPETLDALLHPLWRTAFDGVVTLEVFTLEAFVTSHQTLLDSYERLHA